ncbi:triphosphoribosyl-dephospho-CoA synthase [Mycobacterium sp. AZCC_0083]|uniref:triphosphoribosyl-dephospho-CoA synthase n=1 Tax=Mycobacterium sp. AZCC_0083 TaxID=2735882 RepID=UPI00161366CF|nr:triphosphoribosyl-dephospho-CoA synthase [Mycobacterium sp. AZCC_0083]MBB5168229.1 triphosphoribosyl-dephospho-CoA synthase [Mycobacterium sp. AZCC_0083]
MTATAPLLAVLSDADIAEVAVAAIRSEAELTPKPGLVDRRGSGAHTDMDLDMLRASAEALRDAFVECASAARRLPIGPDLRALIGRIGRAGEAHMLDATGGVNTHRGALWALGLLSAGAATGGGLAVAVDVAARLALIPDRDAIPTTSHGALARQRHGARGAAGEAQSGFPHVRLHALPALRAARRSGADESTARLEALLALMTRLDDTCVLHRGGPDGLRAVQAGARAVLTAGGIGTAQGRRHFTALDDLCLMRRLSPGGSGDLLSATLFLDALEKRSCRL